MTTSVLFTIIFSIAAATMLAGVAAAVDQEEIVVESAASETVRFEFMGEGICRDSQSRRYDSATFSNSTVCEGACVGVNSQMGNIVLVGYETNELANECRCLFTNGYLNDGSCPDSATCNFSRLGSGPVSQVKRRTGSVSARCYKNLDFTQIAGNYSSVPQETLEVVAELMGNLTVVRGDVLLLEETNYDLVATNAGLMGNLTAMSANLTLTNDRLAALEGSNANLVAANAGLMGNLAALEGTNANLVAANGQLEGMIAYLLANIKELREEVEKLEEKCVTDESPKQSDSDPELVVEFPKLKKVKENLNLPGGLEKKGLRHGL